MRRIDCHVHLVGDGTSGSGCWIRMDWPHQKFLSRMMLREAGISPGVLNRDLDTCYVERLAEQVRESDLDAAVLLAQDVPHADDGEPIPNKAGFFVPNDYLLDVCERHPDLFIPAASIHPARPDAIDELEKCLARGAKVLKLLPNCLNIDYADPRYRPFWERVAGAGMILLSHTGGEHTLPVLKPAFSDPRLLEAPLEIGVTVIAAHAAGRSGLWDPDYTH
ncbi:MAG: amidohydrolase family protein, partial [Verrucomicrobiae bacterium]|nr:amidohydrolase family protein [Verrucomicrobiae bacterium]